MQLISAVVSILLSSTLVSAVPVVKRDVTTILSDISSISSVISTLTSDATAYTGSLLQSLSLIISVDSLESDITTATSDVTAAAAFSSTDSASVLSAAQTITPKIVTLLSDLDAKASVVSSAGYTSTVLSALNKLNTETNALFAAIEAKIIAADVSSITTLQSEVDAAFTTAIALF